MTEDSLYHYSIETPVGVIALIYTETPFRLTNVLLPKEVFEKKDKIGKIGLAKFAAHNPLLGQITSAILDYFKGRSFDPPWDVMDMNKFTPLQKAVLYKTAGIPYGQVRSYRDIAKAINHPGAYRFVGTTLANNPYPILIPCHRVIRSDGKIGQFGGGAALKKQLIELESLHRPVSED